MVSASKDQEHAWGRKNIKSHDVRLCHVAQAHFQPRQKPITTKSCSQQRSLAHRVCSVSCIVIAIQPLSSTYPGLVAGAER